MMVRITPTSISRLTGDESFRSAGPLKKPDFKQAKFFGGSIENCSLNASSAPEVSQQHRPPTSTRKHSLGDLSLALDCDVKIEGRKEIDEFIVPAVNHEIKTKPHSLERDKGLFGFLKSKIMPKKKSDKYQLVIRDKIKQKKHGEPSFIKATSLSPNENCYNSTQMAYNSTHPIYTTIHDKYGLHKNHHSTVSSKRSCSKAPDGIANQMFYVHKNGDKWTRYRKEYYQKPQYLPDAIVHRIDRWLADSEACMKQDDPKEYNPQTTTSTAVVKSHKTPHDSCFTASSNRQSNNHHPNVKPAGHQREIQPSDFNSHKYELSTSTPVKHSAQQHNWYQHPEPQTSQLTSNSLNHMPFDEPKNVNSSNLLLYPQQHRQSSRSMNVPRRETSQNNQSSGDRTNRAVSYYECDNSLQNLQQVFSDDQLQQLHPPLRSVGSNAPLTQLGKLPLNYSQLEKRYHNPPNEHNSGIVTSSSLNHESNNRDFSSKITPRECDKSHHSQEHLQERKQGLNSNLETSCSNEHEKSVESTFSRQASDSELMSKSNLRQKVSKDASEASKWSSELLSDLSFDESYCTDYTPHAFGEPINHLLPSNVSASKQWRGVDNISLISSFRSKEELDNNQMTSSHIPVFKRVIGLEHDNNDKDIMFKKHFSFNEKAQVVRTNPPKARYVTTIYLTSNEEVTSSNVNINNIFELNSRRNVQRITDEKATKISVAENKLLQLQVENSGTSRPHIEVEKEKFTNSAEIPKVQEEFVDTNTENGAGSGTLYRSRSNLKRHSFRANERNEQKIFEAEVGSGLTRNSKLIPSKQEVVKRPTSSTLLVNVESENQFDYHRISSTAKLALEHANQLKGLRNEKAQLSYIKNSIRRKVTCDVDQERSCPNSNVKFKTPNNDTDKNKLDNNAVKVESWRDMTGTNRYTVSDKQFYQDRSEINNVDNYLNGKYWPNYRKSFIANDKRSKNDAKPIKFEDGYSANNNIRDRKQPVDKVDNEDGEFREHSDISKKHADFTNSFQNDHKNESKKVGNVVAMTTRLYERPVDETDSSVDEESNEADEIGDSRDASQSACDSDLSDDVVFEKSYSFSHTTDSNHEKSTKMAPQFSSNKNHKIENLTGEEPKEKLRTRNQRRSPPLNSFTSRSTPSLFDDLTENNTNIPETPLKNSLTTSAFQRGSFSYKTSQNPDTGNKNYNKNDEDLRKRFKETKNDKLMANDDENRINKPGDPGKKISSSGGQKIMNSSKSATRASDSSSKSCFDLHRLMSISHNDHARMFDFCFGSTTIPDLKANKNTQSVAHKYKDNFSPQNSLSSSRKNNFRLLTGQGNNFNTARAFYV